MNVRYFSGTLKGLHRCGAYGPGPRLIVVVKRVGN